jgi:hypothetical protein
VECFRSLDDRIVVFGMSCVGKTTFARALLGHHYHCFDSLFHWYELETLGLSYEENIKQVRDVCDMGPKKFVLDGWSLSDPKGLFLPEASVYVVYASYEQIIDQYRVPVSSVGEFSRMFYRWYGEVEYHSLPGIRYFKNERQFRETMPFEFRETVSRLML